MDAQESVFGVGVGERLFRVQEVMNTYIYRNCSEGPLGKFVAGETLTLTCDLTTYDDDFLSFLNDDENKMEVSYILFTNKKGDAYVGTDGRPHKELQALIDKASKPRDSDEAPNA